MAFIPALGQDGAPCVIYSTCLPFPTWTFRPRRLRVKQYILNMDLRHTETTLSMSLILMFLADKLLDTLHLEASLFIYQTTATMGLLPKAPSSTTSATTPKQPRLRASCDGCFLAKVKCSKARPVCSRCLTVGLVCRYSPSSRPHGKPRRRGGVHSQQHQQQQQEQPLIASTMSEESCAWLGSSNMIGGMNWMGGSPWGAPESSGMKDNWWPALHEGSRDLVPQGQVGAPTSWMDFSSPELMSPVTSTPSWFSPEHAQTSQQQAQCSRMQDSNFYAACWQALQDLYTEPPSFEHGNHTDVGDLGGYGRLPDGAFGR